MAGNTKTSKSIAIKTAQGKAMGKVGGGNATVSKQTTPGSKGVKAGANKGSIPSGNATSSTAQTMKYGGMTKKKK
jgi:hypothetical protein